MCAASNISMAEMMTPRCGLSMSGPITGNWRVSFQGLPERPHSGQKCKKKETRR